MLINDVPQCFEVAFCVLGGSLLSMQEAKQKHESNKMQMRDVIFEIMVAMK